MFLNWLSRGRVKTTKLSRCPRRCVPQVEGLEERTVLNSTDLSLSKAAASGLVQQGHTETFTITAINNGPQDTTAGVTVSDTLPAGLTLVSATSSQGSVTTSGNTITAALGNLAVGASATITVQATVGAAAQGTLTNTASLALGSGDTDTNTTNNQDSIGLLVSTGPVSQNQSFVAQVYETLLHRAPDQAGLDAWVNALNNHQVTPNQLVLDFAGGPEFRTAEVQGLYQQYLHRPADQQGLTFFQNLIANGATDQQVAQALASSDEFFNVQGGGTNAGFVSALYLDALGRAASPSEVQAWVQALGTSSRAQVAQQIINSPEATNHLVQNMYLSALGRQADQQGLNYWSQAIQNNNQNTNASQTSTNASNANTNSSQANTTASGSNTSVSNGRGLTNEQVDASLVSSPEFFQRLTS